MDNNFEKQRQRALADAFKGLMDFKPEPDEPTDDDLVSKQPKYLFLEGDGK